MASDQEKRISDLLLRAEEEQDWKLVRSLVPHVRALEDDAAFLRLHLAVRDLGVALADPFKRFSARVRSGGDEGNTP